MNQAIDVLLQSDAYLKPWSNWSQCSISCFKEGSGKSTDFGSKTRRRNCVEGVNGGLTCSGKN